MASPGACAQIARKPRLLVVPITLDPPGGGSAVGAWAVQGLRDDYRLSVLTWRPVDLDVVNKAFGTELRRADATWLRVPAIVRRPLDVWPVPLALLRIHLNMRYARSLVAKGNYDTVLGTMNELDVGQPAIQYLHYPWAKLPRPEVDMRWYHYDFPLRLYRRAVRLVSGYSETRASHNLTLVNSEWTARAFNGTYGIHCEVLYPPVPGGFPKVPLEERKRSFVVLGRIAREKALEKIIDILARVNARGHEVGLTFVGHIDNRSYGRMIHKAAEPHRRWIDFRHDLSREMLVALLPRYRYAIHGMRGEHFGIAPAELQRAGCITFVPDDGGPVEILQQDKRVIYESIEDAVSKICRVLEDEKLERDLFEVVAERAAVFSEQRFMSEIRRTVGDFILRRPAREDFGRPA